MSIVLTLKEQCALGFTGKVNLLLKENGQFVGEVLLLDGLIVSSKYYKINGPTALFRVVYEDHENLVDLKIVVEPEVIEQKQVQFEIDFNRFKNESEQKIQRIKEAKSLRPPDNLKLKVRPGFIETGEDISLNEFEILCSLLGKNSVGDLYRGLSIDESDITNALISLRKKNAVLVINDN